MSSDRSQPVSAAPRRQNVRAWALALALAAALLAGLVTARPAAATPSAADIDSMLLANGSPLAGLGSSFVAAGIKYGVDPAFLVAITGAETSFGRLLYSSGGDTAQFNAWNWFWAPTRAGSDFATWQEGVDRVAAGLSGSLYYGAGRYSVLDIAPVYCPVGTQNWINNVTAFMMQLGGTPTDTRLAGAPATTVSQTGASLVVGSLTVSAGPYYVGEQVKVTFTLRNAGGSAGTWGGIVAGLAESGGSSVDLGSLTPFTLAPGASKAFSGTWKLETPGEKTGSIALVAQDQSRQQLVDPAFTVTAVYSPAELRARKQQMRIAHLRLAG